jgi:hypothetical protein
MALYPQNGVKTFLKENYHLQLTVIFMQYLFWNKKNQKQDYKTLNPRLQSNWN